MTIELMFNSSPANQVSKSLSIIDTVSGYLREATSILSPTIIIERNTPTGFNYMHIPEFNRYYFVTNIASQQTNLIAVSGTVDVLQSFASQIRSCNAIIKRQENSYNLYLDDGIFKCYSNPKHKIQKFPYGFNSFSYILAIAGNSETT